MLCEIVFTKLNNVYDTVGFDSNGDLLGSIFYIAIIYGSYVGVGEEFLDTTIKAWGILVVVVQSVLAWNPMKLYEIFGTTTTTTTTSNNNNNKKKKKKDGKAVVKTKRALPPPKDELLFDKSLGYVGLGVGIFILAMTMLENVEPTKALGYAWIPQLVFNLSGLFVTNEVEDLKLNKTAYYMWLVFHVVIIGTLAF